MRKPALIATALVAAAALAACSSSSSTAASSPAAGGSSAASTGAPVTLILWHNYGTEGNAVATQSLADAYMTAHRNVTIKLVSQPADNYFALLRASAISGNGPDLAVMWTGQYALKYKDLLTNLKGLVPADALARMEGLQWSSVGFNEANGPYVMPSDKQFYIGFYNKDAFTKAGVTSVPTTWNELYAACDKLKASGVTPMVYGNGGQALGATFYPGYDLSYLMSGAYTLDQWPGLNNGAIPWTSQTNLDQFTKWAALKTKGCTNDDILTKTDNLDDFTSGKAAMIIDGTWDTQKFTDAMGTKVAPFVPPFSETPVKGVIEYAGGGFGITNFSKNQQAAADFLTFMTTDAAAAIVNKSGLIPDLKGSSTTNPVNQQMLDFALKQGFTRYPMVDNLIQVPVVDAISKIMPPILDGGTSPADGLAQIEQAWKQLPAAERS